MHTDLTALKFNQVSVIAVTALAVLARMPWLAGGLGLLMLAGAIWPTYSPLRAAYRALSPLLRLKPEVALDDPRAHHFAQGVGGVFLLAAGLSGLAGLGLLSTGLGLAVIALAALNLSARICVGCLLYFQWRMVRYRLAQAWR